MLPPRLPSLTKSQFCRLKALLLMQCGVLAPKLLGVWTEEKSDD